MLQLSLWDFVIAIKQSLVVIEIEYGNLNAKIINPIPLLKIAP